MDKIRTRFAPSPTGYMHVGNLRTALYTFLTAKHGGGTFILRIEDTDQGRKVEGAVDVIYQTLTETGLLWDEGPDKPGNVGPYVQSERMGIFKEWAEKLVAEGKAYYCFCTEERLEKMREEQVAAGQAVGSYDRHCRNLSQEEIDENLKNGVPYVIRQKMPLEGTTSFDDLIYGHIEVDNKELEDQVLLKSDGMPTYNFANVIDDHLMGITHVMRGNEYLSSAPKYNLLYEALGWTPPAYVHLTPVMVEGTQKNKKTGEYLMATDDDGNPVLDENGSPVKAVVKRKMSKSQGDPSFEDLLAEGYLVEAVINYLVLLGWSPRGEREFYTLKELEEVFDLEGLSKSPSFFDMQKLNWFNAEYVRKLDPEKYLEIATPWMAKALDPEKFDFRRLAELLQGRTEVFSQLPGMIRFLAALPEYPADMFVNKKQKSTLDSAKAALTAAIPLLEGISEWTEAELHDRVMEAIPGLGMKNSQFLWPVRIAISGQMSTPGGAFEIAYLLGREETLKRLRAGLEKL